MPFFVAISVNGDAPSLDTRTLSFAPGSQVVLTAVEQPRYPWLGDWQSPEPAKPCDGSVGGAPGYSMTFGSLQHDVVCEARTIFTK